jgi:hypothetical protein
MAERLILMEQDRCLRSGKFVLNFGEQIMARSKKGRSGSRRSKARKIVGISHTLKGVSKMPKWSLYLIGAAALGGVSYATGLVDFIGGLFGSSELDTEMVY